MKSTFTAIVLCSTAFGLAATANADHKMPVPFIGPTPPFKFLPDDIVFENKGPLFTDGADIVVGWTFTDDEDDDHPWVSSSPTVTISESANSDGHHFYVYHGSVLNLRDSINDSQILAFDTSTIRLTEGTLTSIVSINNQSSLTASASTLQSVHTSGQSTAELINCNGDFSSVNARGQSTVRVTNGTLSSAFATDDATVSTDSVTIRSGVATNGHGKITMKNGSSSGATALGGAITLDNVSGIEELIAEDGLNPMEFGSIAMMGGSVNGGNVIARNNGTIAMSEVGGSIGNVFVRDTASFNYTGHTGQISGNLSAFGNSKTNISKAGISGQLQTADSATLLMDSAFVRNRVQVLGSSTFTMSGDSVIEGQLFAGTGVTVNLTGGAVLGRVQIIGNIGGSSSVLNLTGADVGEGIEVIGNAQANMIGGTVGGALSASGSGRVFLSGGVVGGNLRALGASIIFMSGGHVAGTPQIADTAVLNWSGGTFGLGGGLPSFASVNEVVPAAFGGSGAGDSMAGLVALDNGTINIIGFSLVASLVDPNFEGMFSKYVLSGKLADGTQITGGMIFVQNETGASLHLIEATVPEPTTLAMLIVSAATTSLLRRRHSVKRVSRTR
jgi:hypothetical protein